MDSHEFMELIVIPDFVDNGHHQMHCSSENKK